MSDLFKENKGDGATSMARLLAFVVTISALVIFAGSAVLSIMNGTDFNVNIKDGCIWLILGSMGAKGLSKFAENKKQS